MYSRYEEMEYISEFLPDEGETVLLSRQNGKLACLPQRGANLRDGVRDADLYGRLVHANERLNSLVSLPLWCALMGVFWLAICLHVLVFFKIGIWQWIPGQSLLVMFACFYWYQIRRRKVFRREILPALIKEQRGQGFSFYELIAGIRQHPELNLLLREITAWCPPEVPTMRLPSRSEWE